MEVNKIVGCFSVRVIYNPQHAIHLIIINLSLHLRSIVRFFKSFPFNLL